MLSYVTWVDSGKKSLRTDRPTGRRMDRQCHAIIHLLFQIGRIKTIYPLYASYTGGIISTTDNTSSYTILPQLFVTLISKVFSYTIKFSSVLARVHTQYAALFTLLHTYHNLCHHELSPDHHDLCKDTFPTAYYCKTSQLCSCCLLPALI